jgi:Flp pilus assembly protein TadG
MVAPIFLLLVFAVIEYSLINSAVGAYNFAAKDAARYGAIVGPTNTSADTTMLQIINSHVVGVVAAQPIEVDIFEATESGTYDPANPNQDKYTYSGGSWVAGSQTWQPGALTCGTSGTSICRDDRLVSQDYLGVHIIYHYTYVTAFFSSLGATITLTADSVQRIEPQELRKYPTPGTGSAIAALSPVSPAAPAPGAIVDLLGLAPLWAFLARASETWRASETSDKERQS